MREHLYRALASPHGIELKTDDVPRLVTKLNSERKAANDAALNVLVIMRGRKDPERSVWIAKKSSVEESDAPQG